MQPGPFLLERLVAIFEALHPTTDAVGCSDELRGAEMLAQVTSLVQLRLLVAVNAGNEVRLGAPPSPRPLPYGYMDPQAPDGGVVSQMLAGTSATWTTQRWSSSRRGSTRPSSSRIISSSLLSFIANAFCCPNTVSRVDLTDRRPQNCIFGLGGLSFEFFSRSASRRDVNSSRCGYMSLPSPTASGVAVGNNKTLWLPGITGWQAHPYTLALRPPFEKSVLTAVSEIPSPGVVCQL